MFSLKISEIISLAIEFNQILKLDLVLVSILGESLF